MLTNRAAGTYFALTRPYPVFRVKVLADRLQTDGYWWRTALAGEEFVRVADLKGLPHFLLDKPLYLVNGEEQGLYCEAGNPLLCVAAHQLVGGARVGVELECVLLDHPTVVVF